MSKIETVIQKSSTIENLLEDRWGGQGRGLHQKADSVSRSLPAPIIKKLHFIATLRNKVAHEAYDVPDNTYVRLVAAMDACIQYLSTQEPETRHFLHWRHLAIFFLLALLARLGFAFFHH